MWINHSYCVWWKYSTFKTVFGTTQNHVRVLWVNPFHNSLYNSSASRNNHIVLLLLFNGNIADPWRWNVRFCGALLEQMIVMHIYVNSNFNAVFILTENVRYSIRIRVKSKKCGSNNVTTWLCVYERPRRQFP